MTMMESLKNWILWVTLLYHRQMAIWMAICEARHIQVIYLSHHLLLDCRKLVHPTTRRHMQETNFEIH